MSTTQGSQKCSNKPYQTSTGYVECINEDLDDSMKYTISPSNSIGAILGVVAVLVVLILIFLSIKAKVNPFDLIMSFFR
jgi:hypothetical protein